MPTFIAQRIEQYGWVDLTRVSTMEEAIAAIDEADERTGESGESAHVGFVLARASHLAVHSRKDGRFRIIEKPDQPQ